MQVDKYREDDFYGLKCLIDENYGTNVSKKVIEEAYNKGKRFILVAHYNGSVVGTAFIEKREDYIRLRSSFFVSYVAVDKRYRRKGIGKELFKTIEKKARDENIHIIELTSADYREDAHLFYENIGFTKKKTTVYINDTFAND